MTFLLLHIQCIFSLEDRATAETTMQTLWSKIEHVSISAFCIEVKGISLANGFIIFSLDFMISYTSNANGLLWTGDELDFCHFNLTRILGW